jgi:uncharacterized protein (DUF924 family)
MYYGTPHAYATDSLAYGVAIRSMAKRFDRAYQNPLRRFFYLPFMHSEQLADQDRCLDLCMQADDPLGISASLLNREIIARFGRFPHRNPIIGRETTPEEKDFLEFSGSWTTLRSASISMA